MGADLSLFPSPLWGRGWTATGVFTSRGGTGEGVKTVVSHSTLNPCTHHLGTDPLTPRLAVPPLPQRGEGRRIISLVVLVLKS